MGTQLQSIWTIIHVPSNLEGKIARSIKLATNRVKVIVVFLVFLFVFIVFFKFNIGEPKYNPSGPLSMYQVIWKEK